MTKRVKIKIHRYAPQELSGLGRDFICIALITAHGTMQPFYGCGNTRSDAVKQCRLAFWEHLRRKESPSC